MVAPTHATKFHHDDLAVLDEDLGLASDEVILDGCDHLFLGRRGEDIGRGARLKQGAPGW
jgi:hypothetical protein